ncbi:Uncharacterised protein [Legionella wadsworthii]|uniref:Uncharacterized protein n=1 Tax=Legionella wadsworthii TaxID=28088 RepID=A0A378M145_9GAMM|nr:hypothetical protein [Legionella wadsworthii]STY30158.1 Uncharacterised protein [Legionella wadsworthii]
MADLGLSLQKDPFDNHQELIDSNPCGLCREAGSPVCNGHGAGKRNSGGSGKDYSLKKKSEPQISEQNNLILKIQALIDRTLPNLSVDKLLPTSEAPEPDLFELEEMSEFLEIIPDRDGYLMIRPKPNFLLYSEKDIKELIERLKMAFEQFKIALKNESIVLDDFSVTLNHDQLIVREAFINELVSRNLLPRVYAPHLELENKPAHHPFTPIPKPSFRSKERKEKEEKNVTKKEMNFESEENSGFNPSPKPSFSFSLTKLFGGRP